MSNESRQGGGHGAGQDPPRGPSGDREEVTPGPRVPKVTIPVALAPLLLEFPGLDRSVWVLAVARFVVTAGFSMVMPFLAMHLAVDRGVPLVQIGFLWTLVGLCTAGMQWVGGHLADRVGRRRLLLAAMVGRSLNLGAMGYAIGAHASFETLAWLCLVNGAMRAFYDPAASALVASLAAPEERVAAFSLHRVGSSLGWATGPLIATLAATASYGALFYAACPLTLIAAFAVATIPETQPAKAKPKLARRELLGFMQDRAFVRFLGATFAYYLLQTQMYHIMAIYAGKHIGLDRAQVGTLFALNGLLVVFLQLPAVRYIRHVGNRGALVVGGLGYFISYTACGLAGSYLSLLACVALVTMCEIIALPAQQTAVTAMAKAERVGAYAGVFGAVQGAAQTIGPALGTYLLDSLPPRWAWFLLATLGLVAAAGYAWARPPERRAA